MESDKIFELAKRRGFFWPSYEIYGGLRGFYDYGHFGALLKDNILNVLKRYYIIEEGLAYIDSPNISSSEVFKASGHLSEFADYMTACEKCGEEYKIEELLKGLEDVENTQEKLWESMQKNNIKCPTCGGNLTYPESFNLMFKMQIGSQGRDAYLRPETAQGIFVNFLTVYRQFREKLPFGIFQIGKGYRNEISPRQGLLRMRELNMAEAEVFFSPKDMNWEKFEEVLNENLTIVPKKDEKEAVMTVKDIVNEKIVINKPLLYFMVLTKKILVDVGLDENKIRFRQHRDDELAHYSSDCWDCEALISYGWIEIVGIADRGNYDMSKHIQHSGKDLHVLEVYDEPILIKKAVYKGIMNKIGPAFKNMAGQIIEMINKDEFIVKENGNLELKIDERIIEIPKDFLEYEEVEKKETGEKVVTCVVEPSYGIDRIFYTLLEHVCYERDEKTVLKFKPSIAPIKVGVFPLMPKGGLNKKAKEIFEKIKKERLNVTYDESGSIGRRYARVDEVGVPYCITVDYQSLEDDTVTLRDRDSTKQIRVSISDIIPTLKLLINMEKGFEDI